MKQRGEVEREKVRKRERKSLMKSLQLAQMSTASMGKFDKKVNKHEPDAPSSMKLKKKKSHSGLSALEGKNGKGNLEKDRNMKIFATMQKEKDYAQGKLGHAGNLDSDKMLKKSK